MNTPTKSAISIFITLFILTIVIFSIAINSFEKGKFTCNKYMLNTYLYVILTFNLIALFCLTLEHNNIKLNYGFGLFILIFILTLLLIFLLHSVKPKYIISKHALWLLFILGISVTFYPMYSLYKDKSVILSAAFTTIMLTLILSCIAYFYPQYINLKIGSVLLILLLGGIIMELSLLIIYKKNYSKINNILRIMSYFFIVLFMTFILYDTKRLMINAKKCINADYIKESLGLFLDIFNIFVRILGLRLR